MSRIRDKFEELGARHEAALIPFLMAGDPDLDTTRILLRAAAQGGADLIELGVPFSDPTADGPVLQRSAARALQRGASLPRVLELVADTRSELPVPIILFGYYNPIFKYGCDRFPQAAREAGADGLLVVDLPPDEAEELWKPTRAAGLDQIFLLAPTSNDKRISAVLRKASGFVYYISMTGVTGSKTIAPTDVRGEVEGLRKHCKLPIGVGFGIRSAEHAAAVASFADAVVVGSALMRIVEENASRPELPEQIKTFVYDLKNATHKPPAR